MKYTAIVVVAIALSGCANQTGTDALIGGALGGGTGLLLGGTTGAIAGGALGAGVGAIYGEATKEKTPTRHDQRHNRSGDSHRNRNGDR